MSDTVLCPEGSEEKAQLLALWRVVLVGRHINIAPCDKGYQGSAQLCHVLCHHRGRIKEDIAEEMTSDGLLRGE